MMTGISLLGLDWTSTQHAEDLIGHHAGRRLWIGRWQINDFLKWQGGNKWVFDGFPALCVKQQLHIGVERDGTLEACHGPGVDFDCKIVSYK